MFGKVDATIIQQLEDIVNARHVLTAEDLVEPYTRDESGGPPGNPEVVVKVGSTQEVARIFELARRHTIPLTPRGAGTGLCGGAVPSRGGIVLSLERMNRIVEIDERNLMAVVEPGVITGELHRAVEAEGLFYPPDPASLDSCTIGGNVATGAGGPRAVKYGVTRDYVYGLEAVLPDGRTLRCGGKLVKDEAGFDLTRLLVGSEGILAVITKIVLRLVALPQARTDLLVPFRNFQAAGRCVSRIIRERMLPTTIEFMERDSIEACGKLLQKELPYADAEAHLLIQLDGHRRKAVDLDCEQVGEICLDNGAIDVLMASGTEERNRLWEARRKILEALRLESDVIQLEDLVVPRAAIPKLLDGVHRISEHHGVRTVSYGHAGDGNVHVNLLKESIPDSKWARSLPVIREELYELTLSLGGSISGEHGIGTSRRAYLERGLGATSVELMRGIRQTFDPQGILNPGTMLPE